MGLIVLAAMTLSAAAPALPAWMAGCWQQQAGDDWTEECWTAPRAGQMMGSSRSGKGDQLGSWEFMRIEADADNGDGPIIRMAFRAAPQGRGWTTFAWSPVAGPGVSFFNAANDYPQRIRYWREGRLLKAEIAMLDGSEAQRWTYEPTGPAPK